jgi:hypothetical protein
MEYLASSFKKPPCIRALQARPRNDRIRSEMSASVCRSVWARSSVDANSRITGQNAFETISRKPDLARVRDALYYFSAGILMPSEPAWQSMIALNKGIA